MGRKPAPFDNSVVGFLMCIAHYLDLQTENIESNRKFN
jgi:hypothetical protein